MHIAIHDSGVVLAVLGRLRALPRVALGYVRVHFPVPLGVEPGTGAQLRLAH